MLPILLGRTSQKVQIFQVHNYIQPEWVVATQGAFMMDGYTTFQH